MNRLLSGLRSRALKSIELSRGLGAAEDYGDCNWGTGLGQFTMSVVSGLRAGCNGGGRIVIRRPHRILVKIYAMIGLSNSALLWGARPHSASSASGRLLTIAVHKSNVC